jgi:hypothetical protein
MPISYYASAIFFARRNRVALTGFRAAACDRDCYFKSEAGQQSASLSSRSSPNASARLVARRRIAPRENTGGREFHKPAAAEERDCKKKKPGTAGLFDENLFRSVHFASFAI